MTAGSLEGLVRSAAERYEATFAELPAGVAAAPGRVNLIGEHTDYNDGFVLPVAIDRYTVVAFGPSEDGNITAHSVAYDRGDSVALSELSNAWADRPRSSDWFSYVVAVGWQLSRTAPLSAASLLVDGDLPIGASLSSSAALELAVARSLVALGGSEWNPLEAARAAQRAESELVGVASGIMDQMAAAMSRRDFAMLLDCRDLSRDYVPIPKRLCTVVMDTGTRRSLVESEYNVRRKSCEEAVRVLNERGMGIRALRDASIRDLESARDELGDVVFRRAKHVVDEIARTLDASKALRVGDEALVASLMGQSHESLRNLYEVSSPELDAMVAAAEKHPACRGARMTGAGFAGAAVALVNAAEAEAFVAEVEGSYRRTTGKPGKLFVCRAESGVQIVS